MGIFLFTFTVLASLSPAERPQGTPLPSPLEAPPLLLHDSFRDPGYSLPSTYHELHAHHVIRLPICSISVCSKPHKPHKGVDSVLIYNLVTLGHSAWHIIFFLQARSWGCFAESEIISALAEFTIKWKSCDRHTDNTDTGNP